MHEHEVNKLVSHLFRQEAGKMAAVLTRMLGFDHYELAEDIVQDTLIKAMSVWALRGVPDNPSAWMYTVAKRKAIDALRSQKLHNNIHSEIADATRSEWTLAPAVNHFFLENEIEDSQLRMMFACCHPSISYDSQLAMTLKTLCGLSVPEIARNFLTNEETITKRLYRAREKIREENITLEVPPPASFPGRLDAVLHAIYLLFNEGYNSSHAERLIRDELSEEAIRLCLLLTRNAITDLPKTRALLALLCFPASRAEARLDDDGQIILLQDQDRQKWIKPLIQKAEYYLESAAVGDEVSEYHVEAAIASCHAQAASFEETNWAAIQGLYHVLAEIKPGPFIEMNKAIATGYAQSPRAGLAALLAVKGLEENYLYHAALGDFYSKSNDVAAARRCYERALELTPSRSEQTLLKKKIFQLKSDSSLSATAAT
jgi:RNA polymerase sigma factor (sigma-70 family)